MTRQEMAYNDAVVEMLHDYITHHCTECADNDLEFCLKHASFQERIAYSQKYGCICGTCCRLCKNAIDCGTSALDVNCIECDLRCGVNPNFR